MNVSDPTSSPQPPLHHDRRFWLGLMRLADSLVRLAAALLGHRSELGVRLSVGTLAQGLEPNRARMGAVYSDLPPSERRDAQPTLRGEELAISVLATMTYIKTNGAYLPTWVHPVVDRSGAACSGPD